MLTSAEITTLTGVSYRTLWSWSREGHLKPVRQGRSWLWNLDQVNRVRRVKGQKALLRKLFQEDLTNA